MIASYRHLNSRAYGRSFSPSEKEEEILQFISRKLAKGRVVNPHGQNKMHINDAYEILRSSSVRNEQICEDIRKCISEGRTTVVLSKFVEQDFAFTTPIVKST